MISFQFGHHAIGKIAFVIALKNTVRIKIDVVRVASTLPWDLIITSEYFSLDSNT